MTISEYITSSALSIVGTLGLGWLMREWLLHKIKSSIQHDYDLKLEQFKTELAASDRINQERWEMKRNVFLRTLKLVDAWWSNIEWMPPQPEPQPKPTIEEAREIHHQLALICEKDDVLKAFKKCLAMHSKQNSKVPEVRMDSIVDLRNAMRKEMKFAEEFPDDREVSWIISISMKK